MAAVKSGNAKSPKAKQSPKFKGVTKAKVQVGNTKKVNPEAIVEAACDIAQSKMNVEPVEKFSGTLALDTTPGSKMKRSSTAGNETPAKKQKVETLQGKKTAPTKKTQIKKSQLSKEPIMRQVGKLYAAKKFDQLKALLPHVQAMLEETQKRQSKKALRTIRQLKLCILKINGNYLEQAKRPARPKRAVQVSSDPESIDGDTISDKITKAAEDDDSDDDDDTDFIVQEGDSEDEDNVNKSNVEEESSDEDDESEDVQKTPASKAKASTNTPTPKAKAQTNTPNSANGKKTRYVVFVGNVDYETTEEQITEHFKKAGPTVSVRLGRFAKDNKPRGFAHVDFPDEESYKKALSMHHSFLNNRRINVDYSTPAKDGEDGKKQQGKKFKMQGMRDKGLFGGGERKINNRTLRRKKAAAGKANAAA